MTQRRPIRSLAFLLALLCLLPLAAVAQELRLAAPAEMADSGFLRHILPRFTLKHRIKVAPVDPDAEADIALVHYGTGGTRVFAAVDGPEYRLVLRSDTEAAETFRDWLTSTPGQAAVTSFPREGPPAYTTDLPKSAAETVIEITGDAALGSELALQHCGRCHVVDQRNRMGGIGSTPSFRAMRARPHWFDLFQKYWTENPHPSFTEVVGVTEPFGTDNLTHVHPVQITLDQIDAIVAFVETLEPKDLGRPVQFD